MDVLSPATVGRALLEYGWLLGKWFPLNLCLYAVAHALLWPYEEYRGADRQRRLYILKNLTKSAVLAYLVWMCVDPLWEAAVNGQWPENQVLYNLGTAYVVTDVTGLLLVRLPWRTLIHHTCVLVFGLVNVLSDYHLPGLHRAIPYLTYLSMAAFLVNTYLALRFVLPSRHSRALATVAGAIYAVSIAGNLIIQHYMIWQAWQWTWSAGAVATSLYTAMYWMILNDDMILMSYLYHHSLLVPETKEL